MVPQPATAFPQKTDSTNPLAWEWRQNAIMGELWVNSIASLAGVAGAYYFQPNMAPDIGLGISVLALRPGIRYRYLFSPSKLSPFWERSSSAPSATGRLANPFLVFLMENGLASKTLRSLIYVLAWITKPTGIMFLGTLGWSFHLGARSYEPALLFWNSF